MLMLLNWRVWLAVGLALSLALMGAGGYQVGKKHVQAQWDAEKVVQLAAAAHAETENRRIETENATKVINAQNAQAQRITALQADAVKSRAVVGGLRDTIRTANAELSSRTAAAVRQYATTASELLAECSDRYSALAAKADGHASDALMLQQAWSK